MSDDVPFTNCRINVDLHSRTVDFWPSETKIDRWIAIKEDEIDVLIKLLRTAKKKLNE